jgi:hypothetical protein
MALRGGYFERGATSGAEILTRNFLSMAPKV